MSTRDGKPVDATFYAQVEPIERGYVLRDDEDRLPDVVGAKVVRVTQSRPGAPVPGTVLVKLTVRVPVAAFAPLRPAAVVVIPDDMTVAAPIEVVAGDPDEPTP